MTAVADPRAAAHEERPASAISFDEVYRSELSYVLHSLRRLGVSDAELEDVAHDVFVSIHRHLGEFDRTRPLRPWVFAFVYRIARDHRRLARHQKEVGGSEEQAAALAPMPDEALDDERLRRILVEALDSLDIEKRRLIVMHDIDGTPVTEIAKVLDVPLNTAYSRLRLARAALEKALENARSKP
ncbi:RNA polymerase sigma factor RpoE [Labilithrix luteola]|uniref:RNA polymerase sigma factor RpoE n=1 Tax=Labilithrix luteola TaxID=1391654 RepID=A0A0K1Q2B1_9BACT|nr:sigma-70 family RNA polymerase sigma factor [Labilithrix luteola]AKU99950.1 RNA polymerase sigma factor RpoE [Labilithrix luteola]